MKVLHLNTWYAYGSTGKLVQSIHERCLSKGLDSFVIFGRGKDYSNARDKKRIFKGSYTLESKFNSVLSRFNGIMYGGCFLSTKKTIHLINKINPDLIHIHCTNSFVLNNYKLFKFLGLNGYKVVITLHAEYLYTGACSHTFSCTQWIDGCKKCPNLKFANRSVFFDRTPTSWKKMNKALSYIRINDRKIVSVSDWLRENALKSQTFRKDDIRIIGNGINTNIFNYRRADNQFGYLRDKYSKILLFITPDFHADKGDLKGGDYFLKIAEHFKNKSDYLFILVSHKKTNYNFEYFPNIKNIQIKTQNELAQLYSITDVTLMLSRRETFSLVTAESISCGTFVAGFKSGGPESIALKEYSKFFEQGDLKNLLLFLENFEAGEKRSIDYYKDEKMADEYIALYKELLKKDERK